MKSPHLSAAAVILVLAGCAADVPQRSAPSAPPRSRPAASAPPPAGPPLLAEAAPALAPPPAPEAPRFDPSLPTEISVAGDRVAQVAHGAVGDRRAMLYLHGVCGNVRAFKPWAEAAVRFGTLIAVLGDDKCDEPGRFKWGPDLGRTNERLLRAVRAVAAARGAPLDEERLTLVGYSQGAARAERLLGRFPERYAHAVLVAGPLEHSAASFRRALGVAFVGGGRDLTAHIVSSAEKAIRAGVRARYFELPGARHGEYGPDAQRVMAEAIGWTLAEDKK